MEYTQNTIINNVSLGRMLKVIRSSSKKVIIPVKNGVSFSHINGYSGLVNDESATSVTKAMQINNMIAILSREKAKQVETAYNESEQGTISQSEFLKIVKEATQQTTQNSRYQNLARLPNAPQGMVLNTRV